MNNELLNIIHPQEGCLTQGKLLDYLYNRLSDEEKYRVELHLVDCELCSEALEGLTGMENERIAVLLRQVKENLRLKFHKRIRRRKAYFHTSLALIVFIVILICIIAYFAYHFMIMRQQPAVVPQDSTHTEHFK